MTSVTVERSNNPRNVSPTVLKVAVVLALLGGALINQGVRSPEVQVETVTVEVPVEKKIEVPVEVEKEVRVEVMTPMPQSCLDLRDELIALADGPDTDISTGVSAVAELARQAHTAAMTDQGSVFVERTDAITEERNALSEALLARADSLVTIDTLGTLCDRESK